MSDPGPLLALRAGLIARFAADAALAALLGGRVRLYDEPPRGTLPVYALFGESEITDASVDCSLTEKFLFSQTSLSRFSNKFGRPTLCAARPGRIRVGSLLRDPGFQSGLAEGEA